jgi:hypothetical protein
MFNLFKNWKLADFLFLAFGHPMLKCGVLLRSVNMTYRNQTLMTIG